MTMADWRCAYKAYGALSMSLQSDKFGWVGLDGLTDRHESVDTEDGGGIGNDDRRA